MVISKHIHKKEFRARVVKYVDSIITCDLSAGAVGPNDMHRSTKQESVPYGMLEPHGLNAKNVEPLLEPGVVGADGKLRDVSDSIDRAAGLVNASTCFHKHTFTCFPKSGSAKANLKCQRCRLDMGRVPSPVTRFAQAEWSTVKDPAREGELATSVKIRNEWTFHCSGPKWAHHHPIGTVVGQSQAAPPKPFSALVAAGAAAVPDKITVVLGTLKVALQFGEEPTRVVVETTDRAGFDALGSLVIGVGDATTTVNGAKITAANNTSEWHHRPARKCGACERMLEGGLYGVTKDGTPEATCSRCCADVGRCGTCKLISKKDVLKDSDIDLLHKGAFSKCETAKCENGCSAGKDLAGTEQTASGTEKVTQKNDESTRKQPGSRATHGRPAGLRRSFEEGMAYCKGLDYGHVDTRRGRGLVEAAASAGSPTADAYCRYNGWNETEKDERKAFEMYVEIERDTGGYHWAQCLLGDCCYYGRGTEQDFTKAVEWYTKSFEQGSSAAPRMLGKCLEQGKGGVPGVHKAIEWYERGAGLGSSAAMTACGDCYNEGQGVVKDVRAARKWYASAAAQGLARAQAKLDRLDRLVLDEAGTKYEEAVERLLTPVGCKRLIDGREGLQALELLKCFNAWGYHGTVADRLVEMKDAPMWVPMAAAAGDKLHMVIVTNDAARVACETYLKQFKLHDRVKYLVASELGTVDGDRGGHDGTPGAESSPAASVGDGRFQFLDGRFPRRTNASIDRIAKHVFGNFMLCLDGGLAGAATPRERPTQCPNANIFYMRQGTCPVPPVHDTPPVHNTPCVATSSVPVPGDKLTILCEDAPGKDGTVRPRAVRRHAVFVAHAPSGPDAPGYMAVTYRGDTEHRFLTERQYRQRFVRLGWVDLLPREEEVGDVERQSSAIDFELNHTLVATGGLAVSAWYRFLAARADLARVLADFYERKQYAHHELNPPSAVVAIDGPPCDLSCEAEGELTDAEKFRQMYMECKYDRRCFSLHHERPNRRSRFQSETSPICSAVLKSNTLMSIMPSLVSAKSAMFYLAKYFRKDSVQKKDILILYNKAKQLQKRFRSSAADAAAEPDRREAKNFVQKLMNKINGSCEYTSTQVAQMLLGHESQYSSHAFWYLFVDPLIANQRRLHRADKPMSGDSEEEGEEPEEQEARPGSAPQLGDGSEWGATGVSKETFREALVALYVYVGDDVSKRGVDATLDGIVSNHPYTWRDVVCSNVHRRHGVYLGAYFDGGDWNDDEADDGSLLRGVRGYGNAHPHTEDDYGTPDSHVKLYRTKSNKMVRTSQHHDYAHRGVALEGLTPWEYAATVVLWERDEKDKDGDLLFESLGNGDAHLLFETHKQRMRVKYLVPILAARTNPPPFPGPKPVDRDSGRFKRWLTKAGKAAEYYGCVFVPHCIDTGKAPCQGADREQAWDQFCTILQGYHDATAATRDDYKILNARFATIYNVAHCQRSSRDCNMLSRAHRARFSDDLKQVKRKKDKDTGAKGGDGDDDDEIREHMDRLLAELDAAAADPDTLRQRQNLEDIFGVEGQQAGGKAIDALLKKNELNEPASRANYQRWQAAGQNFRDRLAVDGPGTASANMRYTEAWVQSTMVALVQHVASTEGARHTFTDHQLAHCGATVGGLVSSSKDRDHWLGGDRCWQDVFIRAMVGFVGGVEELVHGFLEGLSLDQLTPYMEAIQTVTSGKALRLLIHAPPGSGKT